MNGPGSILSINSFNLDIPCEVGSSILSIFQMGKPRPKDIQSLAKGHKAKQVSGLGLILSHPSPETVLLSTTHSALLECSTAYKEF